MNIINLISISSIPVFILFIVGYGIIEKNNVFDNFIEGAKEGIGIIYNLFPTLIGLFVAIGTLRSSGLLDLIINFISPILEIIKIPKEIMPLAILRPISGSASMAIATNIMENYGVDTKIGIIASTIMGSTETTLYTISIYTGCIKVKNSRGILFAAIAADIVGIFVSIAICNIL